jgi:hypothetical protein
MTMSDEDQDVLTQEPEQAPEQDQIFDNPADGPIDGEPPQGDDAPQVSYETETRAREMGWRPKEEWNGDPDAWRPADDFVRRGEEIMPIVKARADRAERKLAEHETKHQEEIKRIKSEFEDRTRRNEHMSQVALERQRKQIFDEYERRKDEAVRDGNKEAYDEAKRLQREDLTDFEQSVAPQYQEPEPTEPETKRPELPPEIRQPVEAWIEKNAWFNRDADMNSLAQSVHNRLIREKPGMTLEENLEAVTREVRQRFPEKFGQTRTQQHAPSFEGGGRTSSGGGGRNGRGWNDMPAEARRDGERYIADGLFGKDPKKARETYAQEYWSQE